MTTERRFVCINFERSAISAYVAAPKSQKSHRVMTIGDPSYDLREMNFDFGELSKFRQFPTTFGQEPPALPAPSQFPGGIDDIPVA